VIALEISSRDARVQGIRAENLTAVREGWPCTAATRNPWPRCGARVQRIRYGANETTYCPRQTDNKLLADRSLSRPLREDWPRTPEELALLRGSQQEQGCRT
jgi:formamidopyrimidine-DNA glycosylase